ncbi:MAG: hypothetical protein HC859_07005 [Bacteroidia bacterium]|nr:hypothetical protein [Bacteroidia bacterium]
MPPSKSRLSFTTNDIVNAIQFQSIVITVSTVQKTLQGLARQRYLVTHTRKLPKGRGRPVMYFHKAEPDIK